MVPGDVILQPGKFEAQLASNKKVSHLALENLPNEESSSIGSENGAKVVVHFNKISLPVNLKEIN